MISKKTVINALEVVTWLVFLFITVTPAVSGFFMGMNPYKAFDNSFLFATIGLGIGFVCAVTFTGLIFLLMSIHEELLLGNQLNVRLYERIRADQLASKGRELADASVAELS